MHLPFLPPDAAGGNVSLRPGGGVKCGARPFGTRNGRRPKGSEPTIGFDVPRNSHVFLFTYFCVLVRCIFFWLVSSVFIYFSADRETTPIVQGAVIDVALFAEVPITRGSVRNHRTGDPN